MSIENSMNISEVRVWYHVKKCFNGDYKLTRKHLSSSWWVMCTGCFYLTVWKKFLQCF